MLAVMFRSLGHTHEAPKASGFFTWCRFFKETGTEQRSSPLMKNKDVETGREHLKKCKKKKLYRREEEEVQPTLCSGPDSGSQECKTLILHIQFKSCIFASCLGALRLEPSCGANSHAQYTRGCKIEGRRLLKPSGPRKLIITRLTVSFPKQ